MDLIKDAKKGIMKINRSGETAFGAATARLIEQYEGDQEKLFDDPVVMEIVSRPLKILMKYRSVRRLFASMFDSKAEGIFGALLCRTKFIDDKTQAALSNGIQQIVILGAGLDTRVYRLSGTRHATIFEVDLPSVQCIKRKRIEKYFKEVPENVRYVPINFLNDCLFDVLARTDFSPAKRTLVIWEGVTQYLPASAVAQTLEFLSTLTAESLVIFTYVLDDVIKKGSTINGSIELMEFFEKKGSPWVFGIERDRVADLLSPYGWVPTEDVGSDFYEKEYLTPKSRNMSVSAVDRCVFAYKAYSSREIEREIVSNPSAPAVN